MDLSGVFESSSHLVILYYLTYNSIIIHCLEYYYICGSVH